MNAHRSYDNRRASAPTRHARAQALLRSCSLDHRLAATDVIPRDAELRTRAWQITRPHALAHLADALDSAAATVRSDRARGATVAVDHLAVARNRPALHRIAGHLREDDTVPPRAAALTRLLLTEPDSPLYRSADRDGLGAALETISRLLEH